MNESTDTKSLIYAAIESKSPVVIANFDFDRSEIALTLEVAREFDRTKDVQIVNPMGLYPELKYLAELGSCSYNAFVNIKNPLVLAEALLEGLDLNFYGQNQALETINTIHTLCLACSDTDTAGPVPRDFYAAMSSRYALSDLSSLTKNEVAIAELKLWMSILDEPRTKLDFSKKMHGAKTLIQPLCVGSVGTIFDTCQPDVSISKAYDESKIVLFILPENLMGKTARLVGSLVKSEMIYQHGVAQTKRYKDFLGVIGNEVIINDHDAFDLSEKPRIEPFVPSPPKSGLDLFRLVQIEKKS